MSGRDLETKQLAHNPHVRAELLLLLDAIGYRNHKSNKEGQQ